MSLDTGGVPDVVMTVESHQDGLHPDWSKSILHTNSLAYKKAWLCLDVDSVNLSMTSCLVSNGKKFVSYKIKQGKSTLSQELQ